METWMHIQNHGQSLLLIGEKATLHTVSLLYSLKGESRGWHSHRRDPVLESVSHHEVGEAGAQTQNLLHTRRAH